MKWANTAAARTLSAPATVVSSILSFILAIVMNDRANRIQRMVLGENQHFNPNVRVHEHLCIATDFTLTRAHHRAARPNMADGVTLDTMLPAADSMSRFNPSSKARSNLVYRIATGRRKASTAQSRRDALFPSRISFRPNP